MAQTESGTYFHRVGDTSHAAAMAVGPSRQHYTHQYLQALVQHGPLTDPEACALLKVPRQSMCSIRHSLLKRKLVEKLLLTRPSEYGHACSCYYVTAAGKREAEK